MKSVLIPVDFSESSLSTCKYAIETVPKNDPVSIWLFHVYADQFIFQPLYDLDGFLVDPVVDVELFEEMKKIAKENMKKLKTDVEKYIDEKGYKKLTVKSFMVPGDPEWMIQDVCDELDADVIVMSTRGAGKKDFLEGNMAKRIMGKAKIPVLAVPEKYGNYKLEKIMFATHLEHAQEDIDYTMMIYNNFKHLHPKIIITYFREEDDDGNFDFLSDVFNEYFQNGSLQTLFVPKNVKVKTVVKENDIDLIAFVAHKENPLKHLFKRVITKKDFLEAGVPVLGLPPEY